MAVATMKMAIRWKGHEDRSWSCEVKPDRPDWPIWSYLGSVYHSPAGWLWRLLSPRRFFAIVGGKSERFERLSEAMEWVEDNAVWP